MPMDPMAPRALGAEEGGWRMGVWRMKHPAIKEVLHGLVTLIVR